MKIQAHLSADDLASALDGRTSCAIGAFYGGVFLADESGVQFLEADVEDQGVVWVNNAAELASMIRQFGGNVTLIQVRGRLWVLGETAGAGIS